eukprot:CAMPEP_0178372584 /NCGR_PEP_ID=MMETSP0689_2-20121128/1428_1 /TAXON_ID=160604 /ORGANISM="Amphidinium massartii, Strain CS-259" /LENGTH=163 /DNA_ID=CAMNT_0019992511 /DNA_START=484 /DNA_END=976 /DNA_ORIENTATION=+
MRTGAVAGDQLLQCEASPTRMEKRYILPTDKEPTRHDPDLEWSHPSPQALQAACAKARFHFARTALRRSLTSARLSCSGRRAERAGTAPDTSLLPLARPWRPASAGSGTTAAPLPLPASQTPPPPPVEDLSAALPLAGSALGKTPPAPNRHCRWSSADRPIAP